MSIYFTELDTPTEIIFQFQPKELPESVPVGGRYAQLNKIKYNGGVQTNQKSGVFEEEIEWSGVFFGTVLIDGERRNAKDRFEELKALVGRVLRVGFPVPGQDGKLGGGDVGVYMIERVTPQIRNHLNIEYTIRIVPHQRQIKVKPTETITVKPTINVKVANQNIARIPQGKKGPLANNKTVAGKNTVITQKMQRVGVNARYEQQRNITNSINDANPKR